MTLITVFGLGNSGWTVTVAGTVELTRSVPDVEMRLSFPVNSRPPVASQSDSGFAEDANSSQNVDNPRLKKQPPAALPLTNMKQKWTVTVKNPGGEYLTSLCYNNAL